MRSSAKEKKVINCNRFEHAQIILLVIDVLQVYHSTEECDDVVSKEILHLELIKNQFIAKDFYC